MMFSIFPKSLLKQNFANNPLTLPLEYVLIIAGVIVAVTVLLAVFMLLRKRRTEK
jgi:hypothetical protein